ncbi:MAG: hypothetical protein U0892_01935 [Pirellulales bacterium]
MKSRKFIAAIVGCALIGGSMALAQTKPALEGVKCLLQAGKPANESKSVDYKDGKVYFCCDNCVKAFDAKKEDHATKGNVQLVATKQYKQAACPISGGKLDDSTAIEVAGVKVAFCCNNCKGTVAALKGDEQTKKVFGDEAFKKAKFEVVKEEKK